MRENLIRKAKAYEEPIVAALFLINNFDYIVKTIAVSAFHPLLEQFDEDVRCFYVFFKFVALF